MYKLSNFSGPVSSSQTSGYYGDSTETSTGKKFYQDLIRKADSVPITRLFKHYNLRINDQNRKIICPFPTHKSGRESSPSFYFYPQTNSFWCFGCKIGTRCCDLIANMENISRTKAAFKILELFKSDVDDDAVLIDRDNFSEKLSLMLSFSEHVRNFIHYNNDEKSLLFIDHVCEVYDTVNAKHHLSNDALQSVISQLKEKIDSYTLYV